MGRTIQLPTSQSPAVADNILISVRSALGSLGPLPQILHATWKTRIDPFTNGNALIRHGLRGFADANPGWQIEVSSDEDVDRYLRQKLPDSDYNLTQRVHPVEKSDLWRLVKLYHEGGIYSDIDRLHNQQIKELTTEQTKLVLPAFHPSWAPQKFDFTQDFLGASPNNPAIGHALDLVLRRRRSCHESRGRLTTSATTGKQILQRGGCSAFSIGIKTYFEGITQYLLGQPLKRHPEPAMRNQLIKQLAALAPFVKTYNDSPPFDTLVFQPTPGRKIFGVMMDESKNWQPHALQAWEEAKNELYRWSGLPDSSQKRKKNYDLSGPGRGGPCQWIDLGAAKKKGVAEMFTQPG